MRSPSSVSNISIPFGLTSGFSVNGTKKLRIFVDESVPTVVASGGGDDEVSVTAADTFADNSFLIGAVWFGGHHGEVSQVGLTIQSTHEEEMFSITKSKATSITDFFKVMLKV